MKKGSILVIDDNKNDFFLNKEKKNTTRKT
jgi:hypothetical protein